MPSKPFLKVGDVVRLSQEGLAAIYTNTAGKDNDEDAPHSQG